VTARFAGQVAVVTGAGTGLGAVLARRLAGEGGRVVLVGRRKELIEEVAGELGEAALAVQADVTLEEDVARVVDLTLQAFGQVDVLMNNAAAPGKDRYIWEQTLENWNETIAIDLTASMLCSREVVRRSMLERRSGSIVNFSSTASWNGFARKSHYSVAKAGLRTLTKVLALELGEYGIRANCVVPGMIETELYQRWIARIAAEDGVTYDEKQDAILSATALNTISTPEDVARIALFLASPDARTITGQSVVVDAGAVMTG
jgi:3-oxoacyl-[acyl-carrier protein] reductase